MKRIKSSSIITALLLSLWVFEGLAQDDMRIIKKGYPVAVSEEDLDSLHQSMVNNLSALWIKLHQEGRGWISKESMAVFVLEEKEPNKVRVKSKNKNRELWTFREALEP